MSCRCEPSSCSPAWPRPADFEAKRRGMNTGIRVADPPAERPLLIFDGDCGFCRLWINRWQQMTRQTVAYAASQEAAAHFPEIPADLYARSVVFIDTDGSVFS